MSQAAPHVLLVEDDPLVAAFMTKALSTRGYAVSSVGTGEEGLGMVASGGVDLVLLDLGLPDVDGLEVLRSARSTHPSLPIVVVTSRSDPDDRATAHALGVAGYVVKPFPLADLLELVASVAGPGRPPG